MLQIEYDEDIGRAIADGEALSVVHQLKKLNYKTKDYYFCYSTENVFLLIQFAILHETMNSNDIQFIFEDEMISIDEDAQFSKSPEGFLDFSTKTLMRIVRQREKIKR